MMNLLHDQCGLLLFCLFAQVCFLSGINEITVLQSPSLILSNGDIAQIQCSWNKTNILTTINWLKNEVKIGIFKIPPQNSSSTLVIHNVSSKDSGLYVCKVIQDIPILREYLGNGTKLTVNSQTKTPTDQADAENQVDAEDPGNAGLPLQLTVSLAVVVGLLVISAPLVICRLKRAGQQLGNNVIREAPNESEEHGEEIESNSNSSRGSTQWCQVPVYEAYFDHRRDEEDG